jgi:hypothetical protein
VPPERQANPGCQPISIGALRPGSCRFRPSLIKASHFDSALQNFVDRAVLDDLSRRSEAAILIQHAFPDLDRRHPNGFGYPIDVRFRGEFALRSAESSKGAVRRRVRRDSARSDANVVNVIWAGGMDG